MGNFGWVDDDEDEQQELVTALPGAAGGNVKVRTAERATNDNPRVAMVATWWAESAGLVTGQAARPPAQRLRRLLRNGGGSRVARTTRP